MDGEDVGDCEDGDRKVGVVGPDGEGVAMAALQALARIAAARMAAVARTLCRLGADRADVARHRAAPMVSMVAPP